MNEQTPQPNFSQGWGVAGFITALAVGAFVLAGVIKKNTFHSPNDTIGPAASSEQAAPARH